MKKRTLLLLGFCWILTTTQCSKSTPKNKVPNNFDLVFPSNDLLCINNSITFNWTEAIDPEEDPLEYRIIIAKDRQLTEVVESTTTTNTSITISLEKATAYYWQVNAIDIDNDQGTASNVYAFYTKGDAVSNYAPFMAAFVSPENNGNVSAGVVNLTWESSDINTSDVLQHDVYFGEGTTLQQEATKVTEKEYSVTVESGKTYVWKIDVTDNNGAKAIGQTWTFTVN